MKVSVLLTTYNRADKLREAITSILTQTYKDFELVIADDGSTDNTQEVVESFSDKRIVYRKYKHCGVYKLRNKALKICKGKYIAIHDDDDISLPNRLKVQLKTIERTDADCVYSSWRMGDKAYIARPFSLAYLTHGNAFVHANTMIKKSCLLKHPYKTQYDFAGDYILFLELAQAGCKFAHTTEATYVYKRTDSGISNRGNERAMLCRFYINKLIESLPPDKYRQYQKDAENIRFQTYLDKRPKISVIMPYFETKQQLYKTLNTIRKQPYKEIEILLVSDGSNGLALERFKDLNIKYYWHPNQG